MVPATVRGVHQQVEKHLATVTGAFGRPVQPALYRCPQCRAFSLRPRHRVGQRGAPARDQGASDPLLVDQGTGGDGAVREQRRIADVREDGQVGRGEVTACQPVEQPAAQPSAPGHQVAQGPQGVSRAALAPGEVVQPDQGVVRMGQR